MNVTWYLLAAAFLSGLLSLTCKSQVFIKFWVGSAITCGFISWLWIIFYYMYGRLN